jgi:hypothetical protein
MTVNNALPPLPNRYRFRLIAISIFFVYLYCGIHFGYPKGPLN